MNAPVYDLDCAEVCDLCGGAAAVLVNASANVTVLCDLCDTATAPDTAPTWNECADLLADLLLSTGDRWTVAGPVVRGRAAAFAGLVASRVLVATGDGWALADNWRKGAGLA